MKATKEILEQKYFIEKKSWTEIAQELGLSVSTVTEYKKKHGIVSNRPRKQRKGLEVKVGDKFGRLEVIEFYAEPETNKGVWKCKCCCGNIISVKNSILKCGFKLSCGCKKWTIGKNSPLWKGHEEISKKVWRTLLINAKSRKIEFKLTIEYAWDLFLKQNRQCALTGVLLYFGEKTRDDRTASLDRIDSSQGYIEGNVQWVHKDVNKMKMNLSEKVFFEWCEKIVTFKKEKEKCKEVFLG